MVVWSLGLLNAGGSWKTRRLGTNPSEDLHANRASEWEFPKSGALIYSSGHGRSEAVCLAINYQDEDATEP